MQYNFDKEVNRLNTASIKWDKVESIFGEKDLLPLWVADMDFKSPAPVIEAMKERVDHGVFGYTARTEGYYNAVIDWMDRRHNWRIEKEWILYCPGVVTALSLLVQTFTQPGDKIIIQPPVYHPFSHVVNKNDRELVYNPLKLENGHYTMDFDDLKSKIDEKVKLLILCSPHNPVGRVWTKGELLELGEICLEHNILVISDEIHFDLIYKEYTHTPFATISEQFAQNSIICTAPSKTFNLAGLQTANMIIPNPKLRKLFKATLNTHFLELTNTFGVVATEAAYKYGEEWLEQCIDYLQDNLNFLIHFIETRLPQLKVIKPQGTYLIWIDCRELGMEAKSLEQFLRKQAKVAFNEGYIFGPGGEGFTRINIACPRSLLEKGLKRLEKALNSI